MVDSDEYSLHRHRLKGGRLREARDERDTLGQNERDSWKGDNRSRGGYRLT